MGLQRFPVTSSMAFTVPMIQHSLFLCRLGSASSRAFQPHDKHWDARHARPKGALHIPSPGDLIYLNDCVIITSSVLSLALSGKTELLLLLGSSCRLLSRKLPPQKRWSEPVDLDCTRVTKIAKEIKDQMRHTNRE